MLKNGPLSVYLRLSCSTLTMSTVYQKLPKLEKRLISLNPGDKNAVITEIEVTSYISSISRTLYHLCFSLSPHTFPFTIRIFLHSIIKLFCYCFLYWTLELEKDQNDPWKKKIKKTIFNCFEMDQIKKILLHILKI